MVYVLISGKVKVEFSYFQKKVKYIKKRTIVRSGVCYVGIMDIQIPAPYTLIASRETSVLWIPIKSIKLFQKLDPIF